MANRILLLIIGLLSGIIIGGGAFWYLSRSTGKNVFIVNQKVDNKKSGTGPGKSQGGDSRKSKKGSQDESGWMGDDFLEIADSLSIEEEMALEASNIGKINKDSVLLALSNDSFQFLRKSEDDIVVKKDELLFSTLTSIINLDHKSENPNNKSDSVLSLVSGIKEPSASGSFVIEFWKSPINYRGYKMGRNKLVLFGLQTVDSPKIFKLHENLYLKNGEKFYRIDKITDFRSYELINDPQIINQLNQ